MTGASNAEEAATLNARLDIAGNFIGLYTVMPADDGTGGTEVSGGSYARVAIASNDWSAAVQGAPSTKAGPSGAGTHATWAFPAPTGTWGLCIGFGIFSASSGGTMLYSGLLGVNQQVNNGDPAPQFDSTHQVIVQMGDVGDTF